MTSESSGLKQLMGSGIELGATQVLRVDVILEVGPVSERVQVSGEAPRLQTDSAPI
jgi:hypothetical protein